MQRFSAIIAVLVLSVAAAAQQSAGNLEAVLNLMDKNAATFRSAETDFVWDQYQRVIDEKDSQAGRMYFRRVGKDTQMAADIQQPERKYVLFADGRVRLYQPKIDQVTEYSAGKNRSDFETFLVLGFGGRGHDLEKSFDVKYGGTEMVGAIQTHRLELTPKTQRVKGIFNRIVLWIDAQRGISVQQQLFEPSGDYRLAKYNNIKLNQPIADDVFRLKTTSKTQVVRPQG